jgi:hypothetical protein
MVGTIIFMERLRDSLSKPVASCTSRPMTIGSMVGRRPLCPLLPLRWALENGSPTRMGGGPLGVWGWPSWSCGPPYMGCMTPGEQC